MKGKATIGNEGNLPLISSGYQFILLYINPSVQKKKHEQEIPFFATHVHARACLLSLISRAGEISCNQLPQHSLPAGTCATFITLAY